MAKHDMAFQLQVVQSYLSGNDGYKTVGDEFGLEYATVRIWVKRFKLHGEAGLSKKYSQYTADFKRSVLERIERDSLSHAQAAALFDLRGSSTISQWKRKYHGGGFEALKPKPRGRPREMKKEQAPPQQPTPEVRLKGEPRTLTDVLKENEYLRAEVAYLKKLRACARNNIRQRSKSATDPGAPARPFSGCVAASGEATPQHVLLPLRSPGRGGKTRSPQRANHPDIRAEQGALRVSKGACAIGQSGLCVQPQTGAAPDAGAGTEVASAAQEIPPLAR